jgi:hypothetical protein|tara:strand:- start:5797 stop:6054 length:258 start_codon:yes stop_codon:yes gene_type:complete
MTTLFQAENRQGFLVNIDINKPNLENLLWDWLKEKHSEIYWDIEMNEGGKVTIGFDSGNISKGKCITFSGDNGIFELVECETENI